MGMIFCKEPKLEKPEMFVAWPGIGNVGTIAIDTLRTALKAEEFAEIEPWDFFYPRSVTIGNGELKELEFPNNKFYFKKTEQKDLLFFIGEEQPTEGGGAYAHGEKALEMANMVLDIALKFGCQRVYTSGAAVAPIHHTMESRVWLVPNREELLNEVKGYENAVLMSDIEGRGGQGSITGLNGLLLGVAKKRGLAGICVMGEVPVYLQGIALPYPKASKSVLKVLTKHLGITIDVTAIEDLTQRAERGIEELYQQLPPDVKKELDRLKYVKFAKPTEVGPITEEDQKKIMENIDELFKRGKRDDERPV
jgi:hypothetical protein